jgi:hypothetical protein
MPSTRSDRTRLPPCAPRPTSSRAAGGHHAAGEPAGSPEGGDDRDGAADPPRAPDRHRRPLDDDGHDDADGDEQPELDLERGDAVERAGSAFTVGPRAAYPTPCTVRIRSAPILARRALTWESRVRVPVGIGPAPHVAEQLVASRRPARGPRRGPAAGRTPVGSGGSRSPDGHAPRTGDVMREAADDEVGRVGWLRARRPARRAGAGPGRARRPRASRRAWSRSRRPRPRARRGCRSRRRGR